MVVATNKKNPQSKWIVKHEVVSDVFAEFFYSYISNDLGYSVPECRLGEYKGKIAVYIRYIENLQRIFEPGYNDEIYKRIFLMTFFGNDDREEFYTDNKNTVWQLDNSWSFYDESFIKLIFNKNSFDFDVEQIIERNKHNRLEYLRNSDLHRAYISVKERVNGKELARDILQSICKIDIEKYKIICDEISLCTASEVGQAYYDYILEVIKLAKDELSKIDL